MQDSLLKECADDCCNFENQLLKHIFSFADTRISKFTKKLNYVKPKNKHS